ncbi:sensor protein ZraS [Salmonella enterica subsp. arizonae]|uniref:histidine kinase n=1 Tax=Salmonella enterica subsp. arizonae TaxID=59203 RepID=A0A379TJB0_SALER|nr:sensor protein ZraS [Salmonella enterica subsp. arizonae]
MLLNLYLNAIHAIGRQGTITVEAKESGTDRVIITVTDNGKGISPDQLEAIFTPYFTTKADGTGLGLAVVQKYHRTTWRRDYGEEYWRVKARSLLSGCQ